MKQHQRDTSHTPIRWAVTVAILLLIAVSIVPATAGPSGPAPLPATRHIFIEVANDAGVMFNWDSAQYGGPDGTYYIKADGGGLNELHITNDVNADRGQITTSNDQSGVFYITNTGGRGFDNDIILMASVQGPISDDFALHIKSSGYDWTPAPSGAYQPTVPSDYHHVDGIDEVFTKEDFIYGPQTWKPGPGDPAVPTLPLYSGQDINDPSTEQYLMFIDLYAGNMYPSKVGTTLIDNGAAKVEYSFTNLTTMAAFNGYGWCSAAFQDQGVSWTNQLSGATASGYSVIGVPYIPPPAPTADFSADVTAGDAPLAVAFTDASTGSPTAWAWDFDNDGVVDSTEQNPIHTYANAGTYTVNLTVTNAGGSDSEAKTGYIIANSSVPVTPDVSSITVAPASVSLTTGETQQFSAVAYDAEGTEVPDVSFAWSSSNTSVGTLGQAGLFTAVAPGTTTVTTTYSEAVGTATVTVIAPQGDQTQDAPLDIPGCTVTTGNDGKSQVSINTSGTGARVAGNTITIPQTTYTLTIETEDDSLDESGNITGTVATIRLDTKPIITGLGSLGTVNASVSANLTGLPTGASLTTTVSQDVSPDAQSAFQLAAGTDGLNLDDVAYTMNIARTNLENGQHITGATIRMAVSPAWVADHGADAIRIIRVADDGTKEVLATRLVGTDGDGNQVFEAASPNGFSVFGLAAVSATPQATQSPSSSGGGGHTSTAVGAASNLKPGENITLTMDQTAVSAVTVTASNEVNDVMVTMAKGSLPQAAEPPAGTVYQYIEATLYKAAEEDLGSIQFRFAVPNDWFAAHGCTTGQIALFRYTDDEWQEVPVEALGEENGGAVFVADPDGFGLFAIAATGQVPSVTNDTTQEPTATEAPTETVTTAVPTDTTPATQQTTPQATPLPAWVAIMALGVLLFVRRT